MIQEIRQMSVIIPDPGADKNYSILRVPAGRQYTIEDCYVVSQLDVAADGTAYFSVNLLNGGVAGTGTAVLSGTAGGTLGWALNVAKQVAPIAGSAKLTAGQWLVLKYDENGSVAPGDISVIVDYVDGIGSKANA